MRWYKKLYLGDSLKGSRLYYQYRITYTKKMADVWCLIPAENPRDLIDICRVPMLFAQKRAEDVLIIGLAKSEQEACLLAGEIVKDVMEQTGHTDVHAFFNA